MPNTAAAAAPTNTSDECFYCGTHTPTINLTSCPTRAFDALPCVPRWVLRGSTPEVRATMRRLNLR